MTDIAGRLRAIAKSQRQASKMRGAPDASVPQTQAFLAEVAEALAQHLEHHTVAHHYHEANEIPF